MEKMPTLFVRLFDNNHKVTITQDVTPGCEWVLEGKGKATRKWDGACCAIIGGVFFKRFDAKPGRAIPDNAILCQAEGDAVTGHLPCWVPVSDDNSDKWFRLALETSGFTQDGTYEAVGPKFNANPDVIEDHTLKQHGDTILDVPRTFEGIKEFLFANNIEGIVFHREDGKMCKVKRSDFGFDWAKKRK